MNAGTFAGDLVAAAGEEPDLSTPLLERVMSAGKRVGAPEPLDAIRQRSRATLAAMPEGVTRPFCT